MKRVKISRYAMACVVGLLLLMAADPFFAQKSDPAHPTFADPSAAVLAKLSRYRHFTMEEGLPSNWVTSIVQDSDGFLWFGTAEGLSRFDGAHFTSFLAGMEQKGLPYNKINKLVALPGHRILIGTDKGLCLLHTRHLAFEPIAVPVRPESIEDDRRIVALYRDRKGRVWVGTNAGVHLLDNSLQVTASCFVPSNPDKLQRFQFAQEFLELPDSTVVLKGVELSRSSSHYLWYNINFKQQKIEPLTLSMPRLAVLDTAWRPNCITTDGRNALWMTAFGKNSHTPLYHLDWSTNQVKAIWYDPNPIETDLYKSSFMYPCLLPDSFLLLQRYFGKLALFDLRRGTLTDVETWRTSAPDGKAVATFVDRDSNLWLCPRFEGIYFINLKTLPVTPMAAFNAVHQDAMKAIGVSGEWFGFVGINYAGKWLFSSPTGGFYSVDKTSGGITPLFDFKAKAYGHYFAPDRGDTLWMLTLGGFFWHNCANNTNGPLKEKVKGLDSLDTRFIYRDHYGLIWGRVRRNGVGYFDTKTRRFYHFPSQGKNPPFPLVSASAFTEDPQGDLWFSYGTEKRFVVHWHRKTGAFEKVEVLGLSENTPATAQVLLADRNGNLWMQNNEGLYVMDMATRQVQAFGKANGMSTNNPEDICLDKMGNLWFATSYGLSRYNPLTHNLRTFYQSDGLLSNTILTVGLLDTATNMLQVTTSKGLCLFEPDRLGATPYQPPVYLTGLWVGDQQVPLPENGRWELSYRQNDLRIEYTGINFYNGDKNRYQYRLDEADDNWIDAGASKSATYLNLAPGAYTFRVRTTNGDGSWGEQEARLSIVLYPPFWATWAFRIFLLSFLGLSGWGLYRRQIRQAESRQTEKAKLRQQMADLEMKALRAQMNPHFVFNALNSVQHFILKNDTREASRYLTKFARLMRLILENSESPVVPLAREIELLRYYTEMEALRFNHRFSFEFQIDPNLNPESVSIPGMLLQPHIENAIWHGIMHKEGNGQLWVRFLKINAQTLLCEIEDNGVGREQASTIEKDRPKRHRSTGLANIRQRLELLNAQLADDIRLHIEDLYDENGLATGTKVVVRMPLLQG